MFSANANGKTIAVAMTIARTIASNDARFWITQRANRYAPNVSKNAIPPGCTASANPWFAAKETTPHMDTPNMRKSANRNLPHRPASQEKRAGIKQTMSRPRYGERRIVPT